MLGEKTYNIRTVGTPAMVVEGLRSREVYAPTTTVRGSLQPSTGKNTRNTLETIRETVSYVFYTTQTLTTIEDELYTQLQVGTDWYDIVQDKTHNSIMPHSKYYLTKVKET